MVQVMVVCLLLLCSCAMMGKLSRDISSEYFTGIENKDFKGPKQVRFYPLNDSFKSIVDESDALGEESLNRLSKKDLKKFKESNDMPANGVAYCYRKNFKKGFEILDKYFRSYKRHPGYWNKVGTCYLLKGNKRKALLYYNKAREVSKRYAPPVNNLGVIYERENKPQKALLSYKKASRLGKFSLTPVYNASQIYLSFGFASQAEPILESLHNKRPNDLGVANGLATTKLFLGRVGQSLKIYENINKKNWAKAGIGLNYAVALKMAGQVSKAKKVFALIEDIRPQERKYYQEVKRYVEN